MTRREKILLTILFLLAGGYGFCQFLLNPLQSRIHMLAEENEHLSAQIAAVEQKNRQAAGEVMSEDEMELRLGKLTEKIPDDPYIPEVIAFMERCAEERGASLLEATLEPVPPAARSDPGVYQYQTLNITVQGSYEALFLYVDEIENQAARIFDITSIHLKAPVQNMPSGNSAGLEPGSGFVHDQDRITADMQIRLYYDQSAF